MKATETAYDLIKVLRKINRESSYISINDNILSYEKYCRWNAIYKECLQYYDGHPDLLLKQLEAEVPVKKYEEILADILKELDTFLDWHNQNAVKLEALFSEETIETAVRNTATSYFARDLHSAGAEYDKARKDEEVWHELARASYGVIYHGDDKTKISGTLDEYKKHFGVSEVNLEEMYDGFQNKRIPQTRVDACLAKIDSIKQLILSKEDELRKELEDDFFIEIIDIVEDIKEQVLINRIQSSPMNAEASSNRGHGRQPYGRHSCLKDCITREDVYEALLKLAEEYIRCGNKITPKFGWLVYARLQANGWIDNEGCSLNHWGELLLKEFVHKCSFKNVTSIAKAKEREVSDFELQALMDDTLPRK